MLCVSYSWGITQDVKDDVTGDEKSPALCPGVLIIPSQSAGFGATYGNLEVTDQESGR